MFILFSLGTKGKPNQTHTYLQSSKCDFVNNEIRIFGFWKEYMISKLTICSLD